MLLRSALYGLAISIATLSVTEARGFVNEVSTGPASYESLYEQLSALSIDPSRVAEVADLSFQRDVGHFYLKKGTFYLLTRVDGRTIAAIYFGEGTFSCTPPTQIERDQLVRYYNTPTLTSEFTVLFLLFGDQSLQEFQQDLTFRPGQIRHSGAQTYVQDSMDFIIDSRGRHISTNFAKTLLEHQYNGQFYAHFGTKYWGSQSIKDPIFFQIDPYASEEVSILMGPKKNLNRSGSKSQEVISQFHRREDYLRGEELTPGFFEFLRPTHYTIDSNIAADLEFSAEAVVDFTSLSPAQRWIYFEMYEEMVVDSVMWNGQKMPFFKERYNPMLWIECVPKLLELERRTLRIFYHGRLIRRAGYNLDRKILSIQSAIGWYPRHGGRDAATFDLTFTAPKELKLLSVGELQYSETSGLMTTSRWLTKGSIRNAAFNIGYYDPHEIQDFGMVPITVLATENNRGDLNQEVSEDVVGSFKLFQERFGHVQADQLYVTETPFPHGLAFPGMLHLSWSGSLSFSPRGYEAVFRAHEVAHQWWGIDVDFTSYHDQWLSEGLATYCGLLFLETEQDGRDRYFDLLRLWKKDIIEISDGGSRGGIKAGPLWLGYRNSSAIMGINYSTIVYQKGAWVFHMLRSFMKDLDTGGDDRFMAALREYYDTYRGKQASTSDFRQIVEKHAGTDLGWFFNQWVYGADIPTYLFSYRVEQVTDNRYVVHCKVGQGNVPREFQMAVPITIESEDGMRTTVRVPIHGVGAQFELPAVRSKPKKVLFNDMESVLCRVEEVPWFRF